MFKITLPRRLIRLREIHGLSQRGLAQLADISVSTLNAIESGLITDMNLLTLLQICEALHTTPDEVLELGNGNTGKSCTTCGHTFPPGHLHKAGE